MPPIEPKNVASPNANTPPSDATSQYPLPSGVAAMPTTGRLRRMPPVEPKNVASPNPNTPPSEATSQSPFPDAVTAPPTTRKLSPSESTPRATESPRVTTRPRPPTVA